MQHDELYNKKVHAAKFSIISNSALIGLKVLVGSLTMSVSIIAEAIHSGIDLVAALIANYSVKTSGKPADDKHKFGHGKVEDISALIEGMLILFAAYLILHEAYNRIIEGVQLSYLGAGIIIMFISSVSNWYISKYLFRIANETSSPALEADAWHLRTDVYTSMGVFAGLAIIALNDLTVKWVWVSHLDPIIAAATAIIITKAGWDISKEAIYNLADIKLSEEEEAIIKYAIEENSEHYLEFHNLRTRRAGMFKYIDLHLVVSKYLHIDKGHQLTHHLMSDIRSKMPNTDITIHLEPCKSSCDGCHISCPKH